MHFDLTDDQMSMQGAVRQLCADHFSSGAVRTFEAEPVVASPAWAQLVDMGLFALRLSEAHGGPGLGWADAAIVFEELGRACVPGPLVPTHLAAGLIPGAESGERIVGDLETTTETVSLIEHHEMIDALVVVEPRGLRLVEATDVQVEPVARPLDPLSPVAHVRSLGASEPIGGASASAAWMRGGAVLTAAMQVGLAAAVLDLAVGHAGEREQFQRPIGSFQAVKHRLADGHVRVELARAAVHAAAVGLDDPETGDLARAVSTAKVVAGDAALRNAKDAVQVHGAMGFTWEVDVHYYLKRAWLLDTRYGTVDRHAALLLPA